MPAFEGRFGDALAALRRLNPSITAYDAGLLCACATAIYSSLEVVSDRKAETHPLVSIRLLAHHQGHMLLLDTLAARYGLTHIPPCTLKAGDVTYEIPSTITRLPTLWQLLRADYKV